jgi:23S rRNA (cytidine1920-2'-O)/16S rRNA (cytidine1409-2'-O)-methyltransferase
MKNLRLDQALVQRGLAASRSQAENYIKLGYVLVDGQSVTKPGTPVDSHSQIKLLLKEQYVSRAALKLASANYKFKIDFKNKIVLDVGSSTGGFTDYALRHGAKKVIAVDVGAKQMHPSLRANSKVELHEKTDIRKFELDKPVDIVLIDVSFISLREVLPAVAKMSNKKTQIIALLKPQFEIFQPAKKEPNKYLNKGVVKNDSLRRQILRNFETWSKKMFIILQKTDSSIAGARGNLERFYLLKKI